MECILFSLSIDFLYFFGYYKHWEWSSFLPRIKMYRIDLIHYLFRYFYFALLGYFLLVSLFNRMIKNLISKLFIKSREYIPKVFPWWNIAFIIIREVMCKIINIFFYFEYILSAVSSSYCGTNIGLISCNLTIYIWYYFQLLLS